MANENNSPNPRRKSSGIARVAMWVGGSALFGSLALVLWNRRALNSMHEAPEVPDPPAILSDDDIY
jgi:hypothetical protein